MDMDSAWFFEGSRSFLKAVVVLLVPVWMNPSGWLGSGFLRIGLVFLGLWISYVFGFWVFLQVQIKTNFFIVSFQRF